MNERSNDSLLPMIATAGALSAAAIGAALAYKSMTRNLAKKASSAISDAIESKTSSSISTSNPKSARVKNINTSGTSSVTPSNHRKTIEELNASAGSNDSKPLTLPTSNINSSSSVPKANVETTELLPDNFSSEQLSNSIKNSFDDLPENPVTQPAIAQTASNTPRIDLSGHNFEDMSREDFRDWVLKNAKAVNVDYALFIHHNHRQQYLEHILNNDSGTYIMKLMFKDRSLGREPSPEAKRLLEFSSKINNIFNDIENVGHLNGEKIDIIHDTPSVNNANMNSYLTMLNNSHLLEKTKGYITFNTIDDFINSTDKFKDFIELASKKGFVGSIKTSKYPDSNLFAFNHFEMESLHSDNIDLVEQVASTVFDKGTFRFSRDLKNNHNVTENTTSTPVQQPSVSSPSSLSSKNTYASLVFDSSKISSDDLLDFKEFVVTKTQREYILHRRLDISHPKRKVADDLSGNAIAFKFGNQHNLSQDTLNDFYSEFSYLKTNTHPEILPDFTKMSKDEFGEWLANNRNGVTGNLLYNFEATGLGGLYTWIIARPEIREYMVKNQGRTPSPSQELFDWHDELHNMFSLNLANHRAGNKVQGIDYAGKETFDGFDDNEWYNHIINNGTGETGVNPKAYLTFPTIEKDITPTQINNFVLDLQKSGFNGQFKMPTDARRLYSGFGNALMYGATDQDVDLALSLAEKHFGKDTHLQSKSLNPAKSQSYSKSIADRWQKVMNDIQDNERKNVNKS